MVVVRDAVVGEKIAEIIVFFGDVHCAQPNECSPQLQPAACSLHSRPDVVLVWEMAPESENHDEPVITETCVTACSCCLLMTVQHSVHTQQEQICKFFIKLREATYSANNSLELHLTATLFSRYYEIFDYPC